MKIQEFKDNFGGWSRYACPNCNQAKRLAVHISQKNSKNKTRYFCKLCDLKFELKETENPSFLRLFNGEIHGVSLFKNPMKGVID